MITLGKLYSLLLIVYLTFFLVGNVPFEARNITFEIEDSGSGNLIKQLFLVCFFIISCMLILTLIKKNSYPNYPLGLVLILSYVFISAIWSDVSSISLRRSVLLIISSLTLFHLIYLNGIYSSIRIFSNIIIALTILSFIAAILIPNGIHLPSDRELGIVGDWRGIFYHKNNLGLISALATIISFIVFINVKSKSWFLVLSVCTLTLLFSGSKTSLILVFPALILGYIYRHSLLSDSIKNALLFNILTIISFLFLIAFFIIFNDEIFHLFSDPNSFTGRAGIWDVLLKLIAERPLLGHGFGSIFNVGLDSPMLKYTNSYSFEWINVIPHGHNGYLDVIVALGIIGFCLVFYFFILFPFRYLRNLNRSFVYNYSHIFCAILVFMLLHNTFETSILNGARQGWFVMLSIFVFIHMAPKSTTITRKV